MTHPRPTEVQIGTTLQRVHLLARVDPGVYHALRRVTDALVELRFRLAEGDYDNALRPAGTDDTVSGTRDPDDPQWQRALHPLAEASAARAAHRAAAERLTKLASDLEVKCGWVPPPKGHRDRRGRLQVESVGPDGVRRVG